VSVLGTLYAIAIALLLVAFVGSGVSAFYPAPEPPGYPAGYPPGPEFVGPEPTEEEERLMAEQREEEQEAYWERLSDCNRVVGSVSVGLAVVLCWRGACSGQAACPSWATGG
jgi:hypothetical protein